MTTKYTADLTEAVSNLMRMISEREQLETTIAKQKKRVAALYELVQADEGSAAISGLVEGISDACRVFLRAAEKPLTPAEIRDGIQSLGLPPQANLLASVHTTLKRMKDAGEVKEVSKPLETGGVGIAYQWDVKMMPLSALLAPSDPIHKLGERARFPKEPSYPATAGEAKKLMENLRRNKKL